MDVDLSDSLQHMLRVHNEGLAAKEKGVRGDLRAETDWRSRKFLSERNAYLTGVRKQCWCQNGLLIAL